MLQLDALRIRPTGRKTPGHPFAAGLEREFARQNRYERHYLCVDGRLYAFGRNVLTKVLALDSARAWTRDRLLVVWSRAAGGRRLGSVARGATAGDVFRFRMCTPATSKESMPCEQDCHRDVEESLHTNRQVLVPQTFFRTAHRIVNQIFRRPCLRSPGSRSLTGRQRRKRQSRFWVFQMRRGGFVQPRQGRHKNSLPPHIPRFLSPLRGFSFPLGRNPGRRPARADLARGYSRVAPGLHAAASRYSDAKAQIQNSRCGSIRITRTYAA